MAWGKSLSFAPLSSIVNISTCLKGLVKIHLFHVKYLKQCQSSRNITCHYWEPYLIPTAAVINDHKLDCLKQHKFVISHFCRSEVWHGSPWAKVKALAWLHSLLEVLGRNPLPDHPHSLAHSSLPPSSKPAALHLSDPSSFLTSWFNHSW